MSPPAKDSGALKITNQAHIRGGMGYVLRCEGVQLWILVTPRSNESDPGRWHVEARVKRGRAEPVVAAEWGVTPIEALRSVGRAWTKAVPSHGLAMFDWEAVARILQEVRAV